MSNILTNLLLQVSVSSGTEIPTGPNVAGIPDSVNYSDAAKIPSNSNEIFDVLNFDMFDESIDDVLFMTNSFLTSTDYTGGNGPFAWILEASMALGALFALIMATGMAYKMFVKGEPFEPGKILKVLGISLVMFYWYPNNSVVHNEGSVLGILSYFPNCIGSYTKALYENEGIQVNDKFKNLMPLMQHRDSVVTNEFADKRGVEGQVQKVDASSATGISPESTLDSSTKASALTVRSMFAAVLVLIDKFIMLLSLVLFRVGWWGTIYLQQILLGMLTIFGPIQWAFSILPKWESAWAKWISRYLTVHFYGAMLYFVGFYVLLLFDIVLSVQVDNMEDLATGGAAAYIQNAFVNSGYLLVAGLVSLKCLNLVPDLAAWMIPEGETSFSARNFGEGLSDSVRSTGMTMMRAF